VYAILTTFLGPFAVSFYVANRNLKKGEIREGGTGWNVLKYFAIFWTGTVAFTTMGLFVREFAHPVGINDTTAAGYLAGMGISLVAWFVPVICALVLGLFLKKNSVVEVGPTGALEGI